MLRSRQTLAAAFTLATLSVGAVSRAQSQSAKRPMTIDDMGNCGGPSVAVTMTRMLPAKRERDWTLMLLGYGVGLSWGAAVVDIDPGAPLLHADYEGRRMRAKAVPRA